MELFTLFAQSLKDQRKPDRPPGVVPGPGGVQVDVKGLEQFPAGAVFFDQAGLGPDPCAADILVRPAVQAMHDHDILFRRKQAQQQFGVQFHRLNGLYGRGRVAQSIFILGNKFTTLVGRWSDGLRPTNRPTKPTGCSYGTPTYCSRYSFFFYPSGVPMELQCGVFLTCCGISVNNSYEAKG